MLAAMAGAQEVLCVREREREWVCVGYVCGSENRESERERD